MNKPELISFSEFLMLAPFFDQRSFFAPEIEYLKNGIDGLIQSGLIKEDDKSDLIEYRDGVALLTMEGPFRPGRDWYFSTGYGDIQDAIIELIDADVKAVIQLIDSPGGTVKGAFETEEMFKELAKEKELISLVTGSATSAASLMTFPAKRRYLAGKTGQTGSIGVVAEHIDNRIWYQEFLGEVRTSVAKGELKDAGTDTRGFDEKAKTVFTEAVNKLHSIFVTAAAQGLNKTFEEIDAQQSRVYIGEDGITAGFVDGFSTIDQLIEGYKTNSTFFTPGRPAFQNIQTEEDRMDKNQFKAEHPDEYQAIVKTAGDEREAAVKQTYVDQGKAAGILAERKRISGIEALSMPEEFTAKAKKEDWSPEKAAAEYLKAEAAKRKDVAENMESEVSDPLESDVPAEPKPIEAQNANPLDEYKAEVAKLVAEGKSEGQAMKLIKTSKPELHQAFIDAHNKGGK